MDNNQQQFTAQPQYQQPAQQQYTAQPQYQQPVQQQYTTQYQQPVQQQYTTQYTQQPQYGQAMYQQPYGQQAAPAQPNAIAQNIKDVKKEFTTKFNKMGLSLYCILGIVAAMLFIVSPFMNFASIHVKQKIDSEFIEDEIGYGYYYDYDDYDYDSPFGGSGSSKKLKVKATLGLDLFELSQFSGDVDRVCDLVGINKGEVADMLEMAESFVGMANQELKREAGFTLRDGTVKETFGTAKLLLKGRIALLITPWLILLSGVGMFIFTIINKKIAKIICSAVPLVCLIWLMICSSHFFSIMGIGAWAMLIACVLGIVSACLDKPAVA